MNTTEMMVICREVDRATGKIAVYRIETEVTESLIFKLRLREYDHGGFEAKNRNARGHCTRWRDRPALRGCARW